jgi:hypothetical protein
MAGSIMPGPYGRPRPQASFGNWLIVGCLGLGMLQLGANQALGFGLTVVGFIAALLTWPDVRRARRGRLDEDEDEDED